MTPINASELYDFAAALQALDDKGFQVEGKVHVPGAGYMTVEYDGVNDVNTVTYFEVDE